MLCRLALVGAVENARRILKLRVGLVQARGRPACSFSVCISLADRSVGRLLLGSGLCSAARQCTSPHSSMSMQQHLCSSVYVRTENVWKVKTMEQGVPECPICPYKTFLLRRLLALHMPFLPVKGMRWGLWLIL